MLVDIHIHEKSGSNDSQLDIEDAIEMAEKRNIDALCITDHDNLYWKERIKFFQKKTDILLIVGVEIFTLDGDLLCFGIDKLPKRRMSAKKTIEFVQNKGGVCIAAHPYRENNRGLEDKIFKLKNLDAIEVLNGRTKRINNKLCDNMAKKYNLRICGGSDSHTKKEIGKCITKFKNKINSEKDFLNEIRNGNFYPLRLDVDKNIEYQSII